PTNILNAVWQPSAFITNVSNPRAIGRVTQKDSVFIATVGTGLCNDTALVRINLDQSFKVTVNPGKRVYCVTGATPPNVNLSATVTGGAGTTMSWTAIPSAGAGMPGKTDIQNITVTPGVGVWKYVISAANGPCNATDTVTITVQPNIPLSLKIDSSLCLASNGKIKAILPGGTIADSFNFVWKKNGTTIAGANKDSIISLAPDNYSLDISLKSDATCTGTSAGVLSAKMDTITSNVFTSGILCNGFTADSLWAVVTSTTGSGNFKYNWSPGGGADTFYKVINKLAGVYNLTITDRVTGCMGRKTFNHAEPTPLVVNLVMKKDILCKGERNGEIHVLGAGGAGGYSYQWSGINPLNAPIPNFNQLVPLYADSLCVTVTDINNCTVSACYKITEPAKSLAIDSMRAVNATTVGGSDGTATVHISGGTPNYTYRWQRSNGTTILPIDVIPTTNNTKSGLNKQMYYVTVTDQNLCTTRDSVMVRDIICNMKGAFRSDSVKCFGQSTGALHFASIDSLNYATTTFYRYSLFNGTSQIGADIQLNNHWATDTARFLNIPQGLYSVRVQTSKGCDTTFNFMQVFENPGYLTNYVAIKESCDKLWDGQLHISVTPIPGLSLKPPYTFNFGSGFITDSFKLTMGDTTGIMLVRDRFGCEQQVGYTIPRPDTIAVTTQPIQMPCKDSVTKGAPIEIVVIPTNPDSLGNFRFYNKPGIGLRAADTMDKFMDSINVAGAKTVTIIYQNLNSTGKR
ncbi:MAG: SprB repeat-containing protein, partial [Chitinophagales bacterium]